MTPEQLKALIMEDKAALAFAKVGNDVECAKRCEEIAPAVMVSTLLGWAGITAGLGYAKSKAIYTALQAAAQADPFLGELLESMKAGNKGLDIADEETQEMLSQFVAGQILWQDQVNDLNSLAMRKQTVTHEQISALKLFEEPITDGE